MYKILFTGSSGFLGNQIINQIRTNNSVLDLNRNSGHFKFDLRNQIPNFPHPFDIVIHAAGKAHSHPRTQIEKNDFFEVNIRGTENLLKGLNTDIQSFIFISSVSVYGLTSGKLIKEESQLLAKDPYGLSKIEAENLVQEWCYKNNIKCLILRLPLIAGPNPPGNLASMVNGIRSGYYFNIAGGLAQKSIVLASDISIYLLKASEIGGIYNLTDGQNPTFFDLSYCIAHQIGKKYVPNLPLEFAKLLAKTGDLVGGKFPINSDKLIKVTSSLTFDDTKARAAFGWNPTPVLEGFKILNILN
jgi:nucleoside-diphosphate-sugar epimerase